MAEELCKHTGKPFACATCQGTKRLENSNMMHMSMCVEGPLKNWPNKEWRRMAKGFEKPDGTSPSIDELKDHFMDHLRQGHEVFPIGKCDNFCFKTGCLGHRMESEESNG